MGVSSKMAQNAYKTERLQTHANPIGYNRIQEKSLPDDLLLQNDFLPQQLHYLPIGFLQLGLQSFIALFRKRSAPADMLPDYLFQSANLSLLCPHFHLLCLQLHLLCLQFHLHPPFTQVIFLCLFFRDSQSSVFLLKLRYFTFQSIHFRPSIWLDRMLHFLLWDGRFKLIDQILGIVELLSCFTLHSFGLVFILFESDDNLIPLLNFMLPLFNNPVSLSELPPFRLCFQILSRIVPILFFELFLKITYFSFKVMLVSLQLVFQCFVGLLQCLSLLLSFFDRVIQQIDFPNEPTADLFDFLLSIPSHTVNFVTHSHILLLQHLLGPLQTPCFPFDLAQLPLQFLYFLVVCGFHFIQHLQPDQIIVIHHQHRRNFAQLILLQAQHTLHLLNLHFVVMRY